MSGGGYRAFQFVHPDFDVVEGHPGLQVSPTGALAIVVEEASVRQSIMLLLSTAPGERVMRPQYGCDLRKLLFEPNDATTAGLAIHYIQQAIERWEPRAEIVHLDAGKHKISIDPDELDRRKRVAKTEKTDGAGAGNRAVEANYEEDPARLVIELEYRVRATGRTEQLVFGLNLSGAEL